MTDDSDARRTIRDLVESWVDMPGLEGPEVQALYARGARRLRAD